MMEFPVLETTRTILRQLNSADTDEIFQMYSDAEAMRFRETKPLKTREDAVELIQKYMLDFKYGLSLRWGIVLKNESKLIGTIVWKMNHPENEIGYSLDKKYWRQGIMFEVVNKVIRYLFENEELDYITARAKIQNTASQHLLEKAGFELIGKDDEIAYYRLMYENFETGKE